MSMKKENSMLTDKEKIRLEKFEKISDEMNKKEFRRTDLTVDLKAANLLSLGLLLVLIVLGNGMYFFVNHKLGYGDINLFAFVLGIVVLVAVHEMIHGACWVIFAPGRFDDIEFGILKPTFNPYCTCLAPLKRNQYIVGVMMPGLVLGVVPFIIAIIVASQTLMLMAITMIAAATGDIMILGKVIGYKKRAGEIMYMDHPTEAGCVVFEKN